MQLQGPRSVYLDGGEETDVGTKRDALLLWDLGLCRLLGCCYRQGPMERYLHLGGYSVTESSNFNSIGSLIIKF